MSRPGSSSSGPTSSTATPWPRRCAHPARRGLQPGGASFVPRSWDEPILTAEFAAVGATSMLEAIREVDPAIRFYQASSSEIFGEPRETPQTEETPLEPADPVRGREDLRPLHRAQLPAALRDARCCGILFNHESPRGRSSSCRARSPRAAAAIELGLEQEPCSATSRLAATGVTPGITCGVVADAAAGRARRLRARDGETHSVEDLVARPSGTSASTGASTW